jgi:Na+/H+ antiporter NhaD/arsenite permease-like protein
VFYQALTITLILAMVVMVAVNKPERHWIGLILILALILTGAETVWEGIYYVNWDVLGLILGMSIFSVFIEESGLAEATAYYLLSRINSPFLIYWLLIFSAGLVSIALENVTVVLIFAPIIFKVGEYVGSDVSSLLIGVALASNMAGSATMIGDPPAIITAGHYNLGFMDFIIYEGRPSMFFITLIPMIISSLIYVWLEFKRQNISIVVRGLEPPQIDKIFTYEVLIFLSAKIFLLSIRDMYSIPLSLAALVGVGGLARTRILFHHDVKSVVTATIKGFEWKLLVFLMGVFMVSGVFAKYGLARSFAELLLRSFSNTFILTSILIWFSVAVSAVIDNTPYVVTMLPVIDNLAASTGKSPLVYAWALLLGATLGGGITYIGAYANLVAVRLLEKKGYKIGFGDFIKKSLPFNLANIIIGWLLFIVFWLR